MELGITNAHGNIPRGMYQIDRQWDEIIFKQKYLYEVAYNREFDYDFALQFFEARRLNGDSRPSILGGCTAIRKGSLLGRNLDWLYANDCIFVMHSRRTNRRHASIACASCLSLTEEFVESGEWSEKYNVLPYSTMDGLNEYGVWATSLVVPDDFGKTNQLTGKQRACTVMLVRMLLDGAKNISECEEIINNHDWFSTSKGELHFLFGDETETRLVEFINGVTTITTPDATILTNFHKQNTTYDANGHIDWDTVEDHGQGLERYDLAVDGVSTVTDVNTMMNLMHSVNYTQTYSKDFASSDFWLTEYCSNSAKYGNLTVRTPKSNFAQIVADKKALYDIHSRDGSFWQTVYSTVYDISNKKLYLLIDEEDVTNIKEFSSIQQIFF